MNDDWMIPVFAVAYVIWAALHRPTDSQRILRARDMRLHYRGGRRK